MLFWIIFNFQFLISKGVQNYFFLHDGIQDIGKFGETIQGMLYNGNADVDIHEVRIMVLIYIKNTFSSNHNVQKTLWSLCLLALDPSMDRY